MTVSVHLRGKHAVYDQRKGELLGRENNVTVDLATYEPTVLAILPEAIETLSIRGAERARRGDLVKLELELIGESLGRTHTFRVTVLGPERRPLGVLTQTLVAPMGRATWELPIALNDPTGFYTLKARDVATGIPAEHRLTVTD
jgi:hypothetical protein